MLDLLHSLINCCLIGFLAYLVAKVLPGLVRELCRWHLSCMHYRDRHHSVAFPDSTNDGGAQEPPPDVQEMPMSSHPSNTEGNKETPATVLAQETVQADIDEEKEEGNRENESHEDEPEDEDGHEDEDERSLQSLKKRRRDRKQRKGTPGISRISSFPSHRM